VQPAAEFRKDPGQSSKDQFERESKGMLAQFHNYPSIIVWVVFNEGWGAYDQSRLTKWVKDTDPSRLVNGHSGASIVSGKLDAGQIKDVTVKSINSDMTDVHSYPYPTMPNGLPGKAKVLGEFGGLGVAVEGHSWNDLLAPIAYGDLMIPKEMAQKYSVMMDSLSYFEKQGLSASIYTQPFDVEREQNGLFTYDRRYIKLPIEEIRAMNEKVLPNQQSKNFNSKLSIQVVPGNLIADYETRVAQFKQGERDSTSLRLLTVLATGKRDRPMVTEVLNTYVRQVRDPLALDNLKFIKLYTVSTKGEAFSVLYKNAAHVNALTGKDESEKITTRLIERDLITPLVPKDGDADWAHIIKLATEQYSELGKEIALQSQVLYDLNKGNWNMLEKTLPSWFEIYGTKRKWIDAGLLNNIAWGIFEGKYNNTLLDVALSMSKRSIELSPKEHYLIDTYANLLHKAGRTKEAIEWEKKAVAMDPFLPEYKDALEKMEAGVKTWKE
jgi:tetratricopeptide (TPR) repeat protein